ncbi:MAG: hypothetical protein U0M12_07935 [Acutalibacteraceae bacterium]|nr:hypothetical protein [Acutalibacteraceae bacterium]
MTINYFIKSFNKQNNHLTSEMVIFENGTDIPKYALREIKNEPAVKVFCYYQYDERIKEYGIRNIDGLEGMYTNFLYYHRNERLQKLLNEGKLYLHILRTVARVNKAVNEQVKLWEQNDKELQLALRNGDTDTYYGLLNNLRARAEEVIFPQMLYV